MAGRARTSTPGAPAQRPAADWRRAPRAALRGVLAGRRALQAADARRAGAERLAGWRRQPSAPGGVALMGDSLIARFPVAMLGLPPDRLLLRGWPGETVAELACRAAETLDRLPAVVVVQTGTNDALRGRAAAAIGRDHAVLLHALRAALPGARIVALGLPPASAWRVAPAVVGAVNANLRGLATTTNAAFLDVHALLAAPAGVPAPGTSSDGVHLTPAAYRLIADRLVGLLA